MSGELDGKVAIITGGSSGIGSEAVRMFAKEGAKVVIADIAEEDGEALADEIGDAARFCRCDVSQDADVAALVDFAVSEFGTLDVMFNNAGIAGGLEHLDFLNDPFSDFAKTMEVDLLGVMLGCKYAGRVMAENGGGSIINTASTAGTFAGYGIPSYRAAKAGVISVTENASVVLGQHGIRVNAISPGAIQTPIIMRGFDVPKEVTDKLSREMMAVMVEAQPLKRFGQPADVANAAVFLASERSAQISGQNLVIAGAMGVGDTVDRLAEINKIFAGVMSGG